MWSCANKIYEQGVSKSDSSGYNLGVQAEAEEEEEEIERRVEEGKVEIW